LLYQVSWTIAQVRP